MEGNVTAHHWHVETMGPFSGFQGGRRHLLYLGALDDLMSQILWGGGWGGGWGCHSGPREPGRHKQPYIWLMARQNKFPPLWYSAPRRRAYWEQVLKKVTQRKWRLLSAQFLGHKVPSTRPHLPQIIENIFFFP